MRRATYLAPVLFLLSITAAAQSGPVPVKYPQGTMRGFLVIRSDTGKVVGSGEVLQTIQGETLTAQLILTFLDGSIDSETTVYSQHGTFQLLRDHHVQKGPAFPKPIDYAIDAASGTIVSRSGEKEGAPKVETSHLDLPPDVSNGILAALLLNIPRDAQREVGFVAPSGKGRLVKVVITPAGEAPFRLAGRSRKASIFRLHVDIGGVAGVVAPMIGKAPDDTFVWVLEGAIPALIRQTGQLYVGGPTISIELAGTSLAPVTSAPKQQ